MKTLPEFVPDLVDLTSTCLLVLDSDNPSAAYLVRTLLRQMDARLADVVNQWGEAQRQAPAAPQAGKEVQE